MKWADDKRWSDQFLPAIKHALCETLICEAPREEDVERNTDLIVLRMRNLRISCRVREASVFLSYPYDFTIRTSRPSGTATELAKIIDGWGDMLFYGHASAFDAGELRAWVLVDLGVFREWRKTEIGAGRHPGEPHRNSSDGTTFRSYDLRLMPPGMVVATYGQEYE